MPPLTKADAVDCLEKLAELGLGPELYERLPNDPTIPRPWALCLWNMTRDPLPTLGPKVATPAEAIFAATDAYILSLETKE